MKIATITFALILPAPAIFAAFVVGGHDSVAPATDDEVTATRTNGDLLYGKRLNDGWSLFYTRPRVGDRAADHPWVSGLWADWSPDGTRDRLTPSLGQVPESTAHLMGPLPERAPE
jgi:hypothetical protein